MHLRILTTTDLHGHLVPHDYIKGQPTQGGSLAGLSRLIKEARAQAYAAQIPVVLLDNGDTFQGTPLAAYLAEHPVTAEHPIVQSLNHLGYDALGVGNHDLDHGMPYLRAVARELSAPLLCSNLQTRDLDPLRSSILLDIPLPDSAPAPLRIGILSVLPEHTATWQSHHLDADATLQEPALTISRSAKELREAGADLIVVLAHMGVGSIDGTDSGLQAALGIVGTQQIDALILGHTHRRLPSKDYAARPGVDVGKSTVGGVPAVMAGHAGSDLGIMDLDLSHNAKTGWHVRDHACTLQSNGGGTQPDPAILDIADTVHNHVVTGLDAPVATTKQKLHSYFSLVGPATTQNLVAQSQRHVVHSLLAGTRWAELPLLATAPAQGAGGRDGLNNYICIPPGPVLRRHIAGLNPFLNQTVGIHVTGAQLHGWLEHSALIFKTLLPDDTDQYLINSDVPAFQFDTVFGLTYVIDPTARPYQRISDLCHRQTPVTKDQEFILATSHFRASGGGNYAPTPPNQIVARFEEPLHDSMIDTLNTGFSSDWDETAPWRFAPDKGVEAIFHTHPDALDCTQEIAHLRPKLRGATSDGFIRLSISL